LGLRPTGHGGSFQTLFFNVVDAAGVACATPFSDCCKLHDVDQQHQERDRRSSGNMGSTTALRS
jgi:hypothetical protein